MPGIWLFGLSSKTRDLAFLLVLAGLTDGAQEIPDAPMPKNTVPSNPFPAGGTPAHKTSLPPEAAIPAPDSSPEVPKIKSNPGDLASSRDDLFKLTVNVSFVQVPVTVKDGAGRMVEGLSPQDFSVYEDGVPQKLIYFSSDPFPLSAAVVVDAGLPAATMKKVNETLPSLVGAFSQYDEVALYRYGNTVQQVAGFTTSAEFPADAMNRLKRPCNQGGTPVTGGPMAQRGTTVNGRAVDPSLQ